MIPDHVMCPQRRRYEKGVDQRERDAGPGRIADQAEIRVQDVDDVLSGGEPDRGGAHVDHSVDWLVERRVIAHATGHHDVFHDLLVQGGQRHQAEEQDRRDEERAVALSTLDGWSEEVGDEDVHPGGPRAGREAPEEEPRDEGLGLRLVAIASIDEHEPQQSGYERGDERQQDDRHGGILCAWL